MDTHDAERILKFIADSLEQGKDFALAQAPDVVQQMVAREVARCWMGIAFFCVLIVVLAAISCLSWRFVLKDTLLDPEPLLGIGMVSGGASIMSIIPLAVNVYHLVSVTVAPKVFILEQAARLLR